MWKFRAHWWTKNLFIKWSFISKNIVKNEFYNFNELWIVNFAKIFYEWANAYCSLLLISPISKKYYYTGKLYLVIISIICSGKNFSDKTCKLPCRRIIWCYDVGEMELYAKRRLLYSTERVFSLRSLYTILLAVCLMVDVGSLLVTASSNAKFPYLKINHQTKAVEYIKF